MLRTCSSWVQKLSAAETYVINVDTLVGGHAHDVSSVQVTDRLVALAADRALPWSCLVTVPCAPWSAARFNDTGEEHMPRPVFNRACVDGIRDAHGKLPVKAAQATDDVCQCYSRDGQCC